MSGSSAANHHMPLHYQSSKAVLLSECFGLINHCIWHRPPGPEELDELSSRVQRLAPGEIELLKRATYESASRRKSDLQQQGECQAKAILLKKRYLVLTCFHSVSAIAGIAAGIAFKKKLIMSTALAAISTIAFTALQLWAGVESFEMIFPDDLRQREIDLAQSESIKTNEYAMAILVAIVEAEIKIRDTRLALYRNLGSRHRAAKSDNSNRSACYSSCQI